MAGDKAARTRRLENLGLEYPLWIFDVDQCVWPRKKAEILPNSRPAKITGWYRWPWEYGTDLRHIDDRCPSGTIDTRKRSQRSVDKVLDRLRFDDGFDRERFQVRYDAESNTTTAKPLSEWNFKPGTEGFVASRRISRIERRWDHVPFWDREMQLDFFEHNLIQDYTSYGMATLVANDEELVKAAGVLPHDIGAKIRKAEFELLGGEREPVEGIVYPERFHEKRGIYLNRGSLFDWNIKILFGTALENAPWSDVEDYVNGARDSPLM